VANYVKSTNFAVKDGLPSGDPLKVVKGTEIDTEFNNISTAINSKADASNPTFLGTPFAPTAAPGTETNQIATTAFVAAARTSLLNAVYPVGSIYTNATNATNPGTLLGFGTWTAFGAGRVMVGFNAADPLFDSAEETGGSKDAVVVSHTHTFSATTNTTGAHTHSIGATTGSGGQGAQTRVTTDGSFNPYDISTGSAGDHSHTVSGTTASTGSSGTNANLQPYITVYLWKRTA
jgi:hypothetical protein